MASGNPFRASQAFNQSAAGSIPQTSFINTDSSSAPEARKGDSDHVLEATASAPPKTKKSVRIVSPTTTIPPHADFDDENVTLNDLIARRSSQDQPASPPPPVTPAGYTNNSVTAGEANAQVLGKDVMATADIFPSSRPHFDKPQAALSSSNVPLNPFSRTLASLEPQREESAEERTIAQRPTPGNSRASLDVESFKNLLMTGKPTPRPSGQPPHTTSASHPISGAQLESSSSTDTSSTSRQSLFEHPQETHAESPRTSVDMAESDEDESIGLVSEVKKGKRKPPPAPKHRHGKLVAQRQPQTVSFDSFAATEPAPSPGIRRIDSSNTNKPLPPTPVVPQQPLHISTQDTTPFQSPQLSRQSEPSTPSEAPIRQKKTPPPVPLARRQSQLKSTTTTNRSRSSSNLTMSSQHSIEALSSPAPNNYDPMLGAKSPPPPPPSRHGARLTNVSNSSTNSSTTELPTRSSSTRTARSVPEPPSRRSTMEFDAPSSPASGIKRTSSISSNRKVSGGSTGSQILPPPPPPRRRQSNRSSLDQQRPSIPSSSPTESRRTSTEHRRTSVASESSLRREYASGDKGGNDHALYSPNEEREDRLGEGEGEGKDEGVGVSVGGKPEEESGRSDSGNILDDMEKFQREIDELRGKY
ncbi:hypothetical protein BDW02DRAFT_563788, partial [Decorospora gaudefroyi]